MDDFMGPICILTPQGMQCMSSPVKTHTDVVHPPCSVGGSPTPQEESALYRFFAPAIHRQLPAGTPDAQLKALMITKAMILMMYANVFDPHQTFAMIKRTAITPPADLWTQLVEKPYKEEPKDSA